MKRNRKIEDMSIYEASDFWDAHDFTEFKDIEEVREIQFTIKKKKYIPLDMDLYRKIKQKAKQMQKTEERLIDEWLKEKVG